MEIWCETILLIVGIVEVILIGTALILFAKYVKQHKKMEKELMKHKRRKMGKKEK